jgi:uncharacterized membrane protein YcaP (DUF421 family)
MTRWFEYVVGGDVPQQPLELHQVAVRAVLVFLLGVALVRIGKTRMVGGMTSLDVIVAFLLGSLLSRAVTGDASLSGTAAAAAAVVACHWLLTWLTCRSHPLGVLLKGDARQLVQDGQPLRANLLRSHISENELMEALRLAGLDDLRQVRQAFRERNGEISVIRKE